jgi:RNA polymerase II subunit A-like phosphatase
MEFKAGECDHPTIMKNMCAECGVDLEQEDSSMVPTKIPASIAIVHSIPELKVSSNVRHIFLVILHN